ncbi:Ferredoxin-related [Salix suchowensis]|nr:Ferredoxin-related [Salix suchowensis]
MMVAAKKHYCCCEWKWIVFFQLLLATVVCSSYHGDPANDLVDIINKNRTSQKLPQLNDSPGLGCMACNMLNYARETALVMVFGPNCGVELPTFGTITGHIVGCQPKYLEPSPAFSHVLVKDSKALSILRNKSHTEVGVGLVGAHKSSFFWCILFSNGKTNSTFVLEDNGKGIKQKKGCFSGSTSPCSNGQRIPVFLNNVMALVLLHFSLLQHWYPTWFAMM